MHWGKCSVNLTQNAGGTFQGYRTTLKQDILSTFVHLCSWNDAEDSRIYASSLIVADPHWVNEGHVV